MKRLLFVILIPMIVCFVMTASALAQNPDSLKTMLEKMTYDYAKAWCNKDMNFINETWAHDPDITCWGVMDSPRVVGWEGPNGVKAIYENSFSSMKEINFSISEPLVKVAKDCNSAVITYYVTNNYVMNDGTKGSMTPRVTVVRERRGDKWLIIHSDATYSVQQAKEKKLGKK